MISVTQLKNGTTFLDGNEPYRVIKYTHTHLSRGSGTIKVKVRNLKTGNVGVKTYKSGKKVDDIEVERKSLQYLYQEGDECIFMDPVSFEQLALNQLVLGSGAKFMREGEEVEVLFWHNPRTKKDEPLDLDLPVKMNFKVVEAAPGVKGNTASNAYKEAKLENGIKVRVPLFIEKGDIVRVDTRTGEYIERA